MSHVYETYLPAWKRTQYVEKVLIAKKDGRGLGVADAETFSQSVAWRLDAHLRRWAAALARRRS